LAHQTITTRQTTAAQRTTEGKQGRCQLFLRHTLHAKLYLIHLLIPTIQHWFVGSSNLTFAGLSKQGELNVDVLDHDAATSCRDGSRISGTIFGASTSQRNFAESSTIAGHAKRLSRLPHLPKDGVPPVPRSAGGLSEFSVPKDSGHSFYNFKTAAVRIAAHYLNKRGGVIMRVQVRLSGKMRANAAAIKVFESDDIGQHHAPALM